MTRGRDASIVQLVEAALLGAGLPQASGGPPSADGLPIEEDAFAVDDGGDGTALVYWRSHLAGNQRNQLGECRRHLEDAGFQVEAFGLSAPRRGGYLTGSRSRGSSQHWRPPGSPHLRVGASG